MRNASVVQSNRNIVTSDREHKRRTATKITNGPARAPRALLYFVSPFAFSPLDEMSTRATHDCDAECKARSGEVCCLYRQSVEKIRHWPGVAGRFSSAACVQTVYRPNLCFNMVCLVLNVSSDHNINSSKDRK